MNGRNLKPVAPNSVTMLALMCGVSSLNMTFCGYWQGAVICVLLASLFDFLDGKVARCLNVASRFGAELDSLSDFICFGVAPGFLMYNWSMDPAKRVLFICNPDTNVIDMPWLCVLVLAACCAMRLARFNASLDEEAAPYWSHFFTGVPAPAGGFLAMAPLIFHLGFGEMVEPVCRQLWFVNTFVVGAGLLMGSRLPTLCLKHLHLGKTAKMAIGLCLLVAVVCCFFWPWRVASVIVALYLLSLPICSVVFLKLKAQATKAA